MPKDRTLRFNTNAVVALVQQQLRGRTKMAAVRLHRDPDYQSAKTIIKEEKYKEKRKW